MSKQTDLDKAIARLDDEIVVLHAEIAIREKARAILVQFKTHKRDVQPQKED